MNKPKYIRILEHLHYGDNIRIGGAFMILDTTAEGLNKAEADVIKMYDDRNAHDGGFIKTAEKYYRRVAIVDADTLEVLRLIYPKNENIKQY
ncbi:MAG TPA: hypothetical protein GXZ87_07495 [Bacteroidales bacterium]|nr:hypothetical protein [Bacteroidales bacterium]